MDALREYLNALTPAEQHEFAARVGTSVGYLRKAISARQNIGDNLVVAIERESRGAVRCEHLRPDVDWAYLRGTARRSGTRSAKPARRRSH
jgi:DNA-binding transcriptional regulator YdaS (Cro superfamily)